MKSEQDKINKRLKAFELKQVNLRDSADKYTDEIDYHIDRTKHALATSYVMCHDAIAHGILALVLQNERAYLCKDKN